MHEPDHNESYLVETDYINFSHEIKVKATVLTQGLEKAKDKAISIFKFIRDDIKFGVSCNSWGLLL